MNNDYAFLGAAVDQFKQMAASLPNKKALNQLLAAAPYALTAGVFLAAQDLPSSDPATAPTQQRLTALQKSTTDVAEAYALDGHIESAIQQARVAYFSSAGKKMVMASPTDSGPGPTAPTNGPKRGGPRPRNTLG